MVWRECLEVVANIIAVLTGLGAAWAYGSYRYDRRRKKVCLENYLKKQKLAGDQGQRSLLHLVANLALTEADILQAAFDSKKIKPRIKPSVDANLAGTLLLEYAPKHSD